MAESFGDYYHSTSTAQIKESKSKIWLHILLFIITFITTTIAGVQWISAVPGPYSWNDLLTGLPYSISIMLIISFHEFGHYFAAKFHKVKATLPFYIPFPPVPYFINFGTMGAVIKTKSRIYTKQALFDIGVAGPIAGFIVSLVVLIYGFINVPGIDYLLKIHPDFLSPEYGKDSIALTFGDSILFSSLKLIFVQPGKFFPPMTEVYHYPYLCVGWFGLFITAMNMIPVGQLDGGHISYAVFGSKNHFKIAVISFVVLFTLGVLGVIDTMLEFNYGIGWIGWLLWAMILYFVIRLKHPPVPDPNELDVRRKITGYFAFFILIISFSPSPFMLTLPT